MIGIGAANIAAGFVQGFAVSTSGSRTAVAEQSGAKSQLTGVVGAGVVVVLLAVLQLAARRPAAVRARRGGDRRGALADGRLGVLRRYARVRPSRGRALARRQRRRDRVRRAPGHRDRDRPRRCCCSSAAAGGRTAPCSARSTASTAGTASSCTPDARELDGIVVYRWEAPLFFANAGAFRRQIRHLVRERQPALGRAAVRGDHRHRRHRRGDARAARPRAERRGRPHGVRRDAHAGSRISSAVRAVRDARPRPLLPDRRGARSRRSRTKEG